MERRRDHIFISYATEQSALCDWLARRLAASGYAIWCDRQRLLGGENWPNDIDIAINHRTFRMLALLSRASINKHNPQGEWLKGMALGRRLNIDDFVIPLNVDGLTPDEIPWNLQPINYIPFTPNWATGLRALIKKLESVNAPRTLNEGVRLAKQSMVVGNLIKNEPETLISNCYEITKLPRFIFKYRAMKRMSTRMTSVKFRKIGSVVMCILILYFPSLSHLLLFVKITDCGTSESYHGGR